MIKKKSQNEQKSELICSFVAGLVKSCIIQPFDFLRIRIQTSSIKKLHIVELIRSYKEKEGISVFLKGSTPTVSGVMVSSVFQLTCYQHFLYYLKYRFFNEENIFHTKNLDIFKIRMNKQDECCDHPKCDLYDQYRQGLVMKLSLLTGVAGLFSGVVLAVLTAPIDNVRIRIQSMQNIKAMNKLDNHVNAYIYKSPRECLKNIIKTKGFSAVYVAFPLCVLREALASFIYFFSFEYMKNSYKVRRNNENPAIYRMFLYGGIAGMLNWSFTYPVDFVKTKMISDTINQNRNFKSTLDCVRKTYLEFGVRGFFSGLTVVLVRACIVNGAVLSTFEKCRSKLLK